MDESASISTDSRALNLNSSTDCTQNCKNVSSQDVWQVKNSYGHFCCVPGCPNQRGKDKISGIQMSYYRFPSDQNQTRLWVKLIRRGKWEPKKHDRICSDHFEGGSIVLFNIFMLFSPHIWCELTSCLPEI